MHPRLAADTVLVRDEPLSRVLLMNDARFPWLILVPRRPEAVEIFHLSPTDRAQLTEETAKAAQVLAGLYPGHKINIGALGNLVPQLHIHVLARRPGDAAWPGPAWGSGSAEPYDEAAGQALAARLAAAYNLG